MIITDYGESALSDAGGLCIVSFLRGFFPKKLTWRKSQGSTLRYPDKKRLAFSLPVVRLQAGLASD
ncbi:MAG: hypothetical protein IJM73_03370, partial [Spirochaetales bacterium]|nr:hypothetical protein [Spirochaetales bacterium]